MEDLEPELIHGHVHPGADRHTIFSHSYPDRTRNSMSDEAFDALCATIDPRQPCPGAPGSELKLAYLRERLHHGVFPLWNPSDKTLADSHATLDGFVIEEDEEEEDGDEW